MYVCWKGATLRRLAWIKYYVKEGNPDKALELGWDGDLSFIAMDGEPGEAAPGASMGASGTLAIDPKKSMCRI